MRIIVSGRNLELTQAIKDHTAEKFKRLEDHYDFLKEVHVFLSVHKNPSIKDAQMAEVTLHVIGAVLRVEVANSDLYASIDELVRKSDRSLRKHKTKLLKRVKGSSRDESIRRSGFAEAVNEEAGIEHDDMEEGESIYLTYMDDKEATAAAEQAASIEEAAAERPVSSTS